MTSKPRSVSLWTMRILATLWLLQLLSQIVMGGAFVSGDAGIFRMHSLNGTMMNTVPFLLTIVAIVHATLGRGRVWWIGVGVGLMVLTLTQEVLGYTRNIGAHIVGGTVLTTVAVVVAIVLWRHPYRPRSRRSRAAAPTTGPVATGAGVVS